jgi:hypothetical protein
MRTSRHVLASIALLVGLGEIAPAAALTPEDGKRRKLQPDPPPRNPPRRIRMTEAYRPSPPAMNGGKECARRMKQMARGDVLNWYPGQVRANFRG